MGGSKQVAKQSKSRDATRPPTASKKRPRTGKKNEAPPTTTAPNRSNSEKQPRKKQKKNSSNSDKPTDAKVAADDLALVPVADTPSLSSVLLLDACRSIGQYTRSKRYFESLRDRVCAELVSRGEIRQEQADKIRLSKVFIDLLRRIVEKLMEVNYKQLALICRVTNRKTVDMQVLHTYWYLMSNVNPHLLKYTQKSAGGVRESILEDYRDLKKIETRKKEDYAAMQRSLHVANDDYDSLVVEETLAKIVQPA